MNNRIQKIAEQAGIIPGVMGLNRFTHFDPEKFAELIVEECLNLVDRGGEFVSRPKLVERIKEHFGVE